ncbi:copper resistance protein NlpE [Hymenobacter sp. HSC-4F20]|uniref:copper resistance protein NlpE n=1 Tax=Hymenobacter sp. HSC-4F20 TaxID=2864135 RepID=UPI001C72F015|nr:copper resistance protein NlpE [Hymenobacter sp. HSC-4F20]MBX0290354.1 copper resistance protein NlpE [Hymenobacter sp. HSC-4F20]
MLYRFVLAALLGFSGFSAVAQRTSPTVPRLAPSFFTTYSYLTYSILDRGTSPTPMPAKGVGGTLTLRPDGTYQKRLTLSANGGTMPFDQDGRYTFAGNRISFSYTDKKGQSRTDAGTFQLRNGLLTLTMQGYPAGNQSIYTLRQQ